MPTSVTPQYLLEGAVYALEQCGLLLRDANLLNRSGSYASAIVLAAFAREELGRWKILLDLRGEVLGGKTVGIKEIKTCCEDHVEKQKKGMLSTTIRPDIDFELDTSLRTRMHASPGSKEWTDVDEQLGEIDRKSKKKTPSARHTQRECALYVEPRLTGWNRPAKISKTSAYVFLVDAMNDYSNVYGNHYITPGHPVEVIDPELFKALEQWSGRPELPRPERPGDAP